MYFLLLFFLSSVQSQGGEVLPITLYHSFTLGALSSAQGPGAVWMISGTNASVFLVITIDWLSLIKKKSKVESTEQ